MNDRTSKMLEILTSQKNEHNVLSQLVSMNINQDDYDLLKNEVEAINEINSLERQKVEKERTDILKKLDHRSLSVLDRTTYHHAIQSCDDILKNTPNEVPLSLAHDALIKVISSTKANLMKNELKQKLDALSVDISILKGLMYKSSSISVSDIEKELSSIFKFPDIKHLSDNEIKDL